LTAAAFTESESFWPLIWTLEKGMPLDVRIFPWLAGSWDNLPHVRSALNWSPFDQTICLNFLDAKYMFASKNYCFRKVFSIQCICKFLKSTLWYGTYMVCTCRGDFWTLTHNGASLFFISKGKVEKIAITPNCEIC
jgi:hypothetical protein